MAAVATIVEIDDKTRAPTPGAVELQVDFNPQSLGLTHSCTGPGATQGGADGLEEGKSVSAGQQTGYETELSLDLLFDTSRDGSDVRAKTLVLVALTRPAGNGNTAAAGKLVRFSWGSFLFVGHIRTLGETIDLFSPDGVPLRATLSLSLTGVAERDLRPDSAAGLGIGAGAGLGISAGAGVAAGVGISAGAGASFGAGVGASAGAGASFGGGVTTSVGATPLRLATSGDTVQSIAARAGVSWKVLAAANGIDNPRLLTPGTALDLRVTAT